MADFKERHRPKHLDVNNPDADVDDDKEDTDVDVVHIPGIDDRKTRKNRFWMSVLRSLVWGVYFVSLSTIVALLSEECPCPSTSQPKITLRNDFRI